MHKYAPENPPGTFPPRRHNRTPSCAPSLSLLPQRLLLRLSLRKRADRMVGRGHADSRSEITSTSKAVDFIRLPKAYWREVLGRESAFPQRPGAGRTQTPVSGFSPAGKRFWPPWSSPGRGGRCVRSAAPSLLPPVTHTLGPPRGRTLSLREEKVLVQPHSSTRGAGSLPPPTLAARSKLPCFLRFMKVLLKVLSAALQLGFLGEEGSVLQAGIK